MEFISILWNLGFTMYIFWTAESRNKVVVTKNLANYPKWVELVVVLFGLLVFVKETEN